MANIHVTKQSFNSGEISPLMTNRHGVEKVASGCRKLRNFYIHVHGPAFRRPGMVEMGLSKNQTTATKSRLYGFNFSTTTGFVLEICSDGLQVWSNGALVTLDAPVAFPYTDAEVFEVQMWQVNDVVYLAHKNHAPRRLIRYTDTDWQIDEVPWVWPPMGDENTGADTLSLASDFFSDSLGNLYESPDGNNYLTA